jgi:hypothetical protein
MQEGMGEGSLIHRNGGGAVSGLRGDAWKNDDPADGRRDEGWRKVKPLRTATTRGGQEWTREEYGSDRREVKKGARVGGKLKGIERE